MSVPMQMGGCQGLIIARQRFGERQRRLLRTLLLYNDKQDQLLPICPKAQSRTKEAIELRPTKLQRLSMLKSIFKRLKQVDRDRKVGVEFQVPARGAEGAAVLGAGGPRI